VENAGVENAGVWKSMESEDLKNVFLTVLTERIVWKQTRTLLVHKGGLSRDDFLGVLKVNLSRLTK